MNVLDAYHLPDLREDDLRGWRVSEFDGGEVGLRYPLLRPQGLARLLGRLAEARRANLAERRTTEIVNTLDAAAARLADPASVERRQAEAALPAVTGYSPAMVRLILDRMTSDWRADRLRQLLRSEFQDPSVLESFRPLPAREMGPHRRAYGPRLSFHVFAGNVPGVAVTSIVRALLVRSAVLGKTASGEPLLPALFARALAAVGPGLGECVAVTYWPGGDESLEDVVLARADTVVAYGGEGVVRSLRGRIPAAARLVTHGPRLSLGILGREALRPRELDALLPEIAEAVAAFDQHGCVSPHALYVERGGEVTPVVFAGLLAEALKRVEERLPRGTVAPEEAARIHQLRGRVELEELAGGEAAVFAGAGTSYTVLYHGKSDLEVSCLNRLIWVKPLDALEEVVEHLGPYGGSIQTVGVAGAGGRLAGLAELLGQVGVCRISDFRRMPWPPPDWHHDGGEPLRELVRWTDLED